MKVVIACDGSEHSERGMKLAANMPFKSATFKLVNVVPEIEFEEEYFTDEEAENIKNYNNDMWVQSKKLLEKNKEIFKEYGLECTVESLGGEASTVLKKLSKENDLMVMGTRGLNPFKGFFLGSVSDSILRYGSCSLLLSMPEESQQDFSVKKIMIGYDDSASSLDACQYVKNFELSKVDSVDVVAIIQTIPFYGMNYSLAALEFWPKYKKILEKSLNTVQKNIEDLSQSQTVNTEVITDTHDISDTLRKYSNEKEMDLMIVGSKGKSMVESVIVGSVSNRLAHHSDVPLLIVR